MITLSIIIPLAANETAWQSLLTELKQLPDHTEALFVIPAQDQVTSIALPPSNKNTQVLQAKAGRAEQMNAGAEIAQGQYLWFLHADSKFADDTLPTILSALQTQPDHLLYFDLAFLSDGSPLMCLNRWGAYFRSHVLKTPFGDQGFCLKKTLFEAVGGFPEDLAYGEDHVFVWRLRQHGIHLKPLGAKLYTSARKYKQHGWLKTTLMHQYLWLKQAFPEWLKLRRQAQKQRRS